jgi:hypothetical protein
MILASGEPRRPPAGLCTLRGGAGLRRDTLRWILGGLWLLDGLLQLQPGMFTMAMVRGVLQPATVGNPAWVNLPLTFAIRIFSAHIVVANAGVAAVQLLLGAAILLAGGRRRWPFVLSLIWAALLWPFGQACGDLLSGSASVWTGAPGSAVLYGLLTWAAWPVGEEAAARRRQYVVGALGGIWALAAVLQVNRAFFTAQGLASLITGNVPGQPPWLAALLTAAGRVAAAHPVAGNVVATAVAAACALGIWSVRLRRPALLVSIVASAFAWVFGQAFGMLLTGMATDPNTAPLVAILALAVWPDGRGSAGEQGGVAAAQGLAGGGGAPRAEADVPMAVGESERERAEAALRRLAGPRSGGGGMPCRSGTSDAPA